VPELDGLIDARRRQDLAVRTEGDAVDQLLVALERLLQLAAAGLPDFDTAVGGPGREALAVRAERQAPEEIAIAQCPPLLGAGRGLECGTALPGAVGVGRGQALAVRTEDAAVDRAAVARERVRFPVVLQVPDPAYRALVLSDLRKGDAIAVWGEGDAGPE